MRVQNTWDSRCLGADQLCVLVQLPKTKTGVRLILCCSALLLLCFLKGIHFVLIITTVHTLSARLFPTLPALLMFLAAMRLQKKAVQISVAQQN